MERIVFTNGCFDLLHKGHLYILKEASKLGRLIVGLNSDSSVRRLKGENRPYQDQITRKRALDALDFVEKVIIFYDSTPLEIIKVIKPDIIVKGGDYRSEDVVGYDLVDEVIIVPLLPGYSTTNILNGWSDKNVY